MGALGTQTPSHRVFGALGHVFCSFFPSYQTHAAAETSWYEPPGQLLSIAAEGIAELTVGRGTPGEAKGNSLQQNG